MDDEYLFKIALDATDFNAGIQAMRSLLGEMQDAIGGNQRAFATLDNQITKFESSVTGAAAASGKMTAETRSMAEGFAALLSQLKEASDAYKTFREEQVVGNGVSNPQADVWAKSIAELREYIAISEAASASFVGEAKRRLSIEQQLTNQLEAEDKRRIASHQAEYDAMVAMDLAIEVADKQRIQSAAAALTAEVQARKKAAAEGATYLAGGTGAYAGLSTSAQRRTVGNAYTVQPSDGTGSQAELDASANELANMRTYYETLDKENTAKRASVPLSDAVVASRNREAAATDRVNSVLARNSTGLARTSTELPRLRYALYDISTTFTILGTGMLAYGGAIAKTASDYQTSFASVARTSKNLSQGELGQLKSDLVALSTQIPVTFDDISKIATLGNQLNIPSEQLSNFTKVVAQFSASSNMSVDASATAFGRLGQIFHDTNYQALGDQIAYLGVRAVATEADIVKVSQQIAVTTSSYGISEKNTIALATAYASLGVKAESARGSTVRFLADLQKAVVQGGAPLAQIADVTGMSTTAFSKLFSEDANAGMTRFLQGLSRYGRDSKNVLAELGITAQRDITNIGLLAQNTPVLLAAQQQANQAGGALQAMFDKQTNTIGAQLTLAGNKFQSMLNDIGTGSSVPLRALVDGLNGLLNVLDKVTKDPVAVTLAVISAAVVTLTGGLLVATGVAAQYAASILAVRTYMEAMGVQGSSLKAMFGAVTGSTQRAVAANVAYSDSLRAGASESQLQIVNAAALADSRRRLDVVTSEAAVADAEYNLELAKGAGVREGVIASEIALARARADLNLALAQQGVAEAEAQLNAVKYTGTLDEATFATTRLEVATLKLAAAQDEVALASRTSALAQQEGALSSLANKEETAAKGGSKLAGALGKAGMVGSILALLPLIPVVIDAMHQWGTSISGTSADVDTLTSKILGLSDKTAGKQNLNALTTALRAGDNLNPLNHIGDGLQTPFGGYAEVAFNQFQANNGRFYNPTQGAVNQMTRGQTTPGTDISYLNGGQLFNSRVGEATTSIKNVDQGIATAIQKGDLADAKKALDAYDATMKDLRVNSTDAEKALAATAAALNLTKGQSISAALASKISDDAATKQARAFSTIVTAAFATGPALNAAQQGMAALGASFETSGASATINGGALKKVIEQIYADTGGGMAAASQMQGLFDTLVRGGFASVAQLKPLRDIINQLAGGAKVVSSTPDGVAEFYKAWNKEAEAANKAASKAASAAEAQSRTLQDYANDINNTISSMLSYQFGVGDAQDKITQTWSQIKSDAASAAVSAKSIRTDLLALYATRTTATFALAVDSAYGDVAATAQDRATIAKTNGEIAGKQKDLKSATDSASMSLVGNSDAAIKNRQALEGQVSGYQAYIVALAQSGASQKQIDAAIAKSKQEFIAHATQLGYNRQQVDKLATAFDGMKTVVNAIPRNVTTGVSAKTSAAMKALADYRASIKQTNGMSVSTPIRTYPVPDDPGIALGNSIMDGLRKTLGSQGAFDFIFETPQGKKQKEGSLVLQSAQGTYHAPPKPHTHDGLTHPFGLGQNYYGGGWTGNGGIYDAAGVVHGQEFVLNAIGAKILPMADLLAMNQGRAPQSASPTVVIAGGGRGQGFTTQDKLFLAQVLGAKPSITLSADQFGHAVDGANVRANLRGAG